jgi:hypothetical protein
MILNAHSLIAVPPETHYFTKYWKNCQGKRCFENRERYQDFIDQFLGSREVEDMGFNISKRNQIGEQLKSIPSPGHDKVLTVVMDRYTRDHGKTMWIEKTPGHLPHIPTIESLFPGSRFLCVIRDPRAVSRSWLSMPGDRGNVLNSALRWTWYSSLISRYHRRNYKLLEIYYENLVSVPETTLSEICEFLEIEYEGDMLSYFEDPMPTFNLEREPWKEMSLQKIDQSRQEKWKHELTSAEIMVVQVICAKGIRDRSYSRFPQRLTPARLQNIVVIFLAGILREMRILLRSPFRRIRRVFSSYFQ